MGSWTVQRFDSLTDAQLEASLEIQTECTKDDLGVLCLAGGDPKLIPLLNRAMLPAAVSVGEYYGAVDENGEILGFVVWVPPGQELNSTPEQRELGLNDFMANLSDVGKHYYQTVIKDELIPFTNDCLGGPTTKLNSWWLNIAMVRPDKRRQGILKALVRPVIEKALKRGERCALSCTNSLNAGIYRKVGFTLLGERPMSSPWGSWTMYIMEVQKPTP